MARVRVRSDMSGARAKASRICKGDALGRFLASEAARGMDPYVPMREGFLSSSARISPFEVTYRAKYAKVVYHGVRNGRKLRFSKDRHRLATSRWDVHYSEAHLPELARAASRYLGR